MANTLILQNRYMKQIILGIFALLITVVGFSQKHTPVEIRQLAYRKLPNGQKPLGLDLDKYIKSYITSDTSISLGGGGSSATDSIYANITYDDLYTLYDNAQLVKGKKYRITDYKTVFNLNISGDTYTDASVESIVVTAANQSQLEPIAFSPAYPKDILYYTLDGGTYMPGSTKGCIYRRIDTEKNISVPFDFREFKVEVAAWTDYDSYNVLGEYTRGKIVGDAGSFYISKIYSNIGNAVGDNQYWQLISDVSFLKSLKPITFFVDNMISANGTPTSPSLCFNIGGSYNFVINQQPTTISECLFLTYGYIKDCTFDRLDNCFFNTEDELLNNHCGIIKDYILTSGQFRYNNLAGVEGLIMGTFNNNTIAKGFNNNFIASASGNTIAADATGNIIGDGFRDNTIGLRFQNNTIGNNFGNVSMLNKYGNHIGNDFHDNVIANDFSDNVIGNWFYQNIVADYFQSNNLPFKFYGNTLPAEFQTWNAQCALWNKDFTGLTLPNPDTSKYLIFDLTDEWSWGYWDNGTFVLTAF